MGTGEPRESAARFATGLVTVGAARSALPAGLSPC